MALVKFLSDSNTIIIIRKIARGLSDELRIRLSSGATANLIGPRYYDIGKYLIVGEHGTIADYSLPNGYHICISVQRTPENGYPGLSINGKLLDPTEEERLFYKYLPKHRLVDVKINEPLWMNQMKILRSVSNLDGFWYNPVESFYDRLPWYFLNKFGFFLDIPVGSIHSVIKLPLKILSRI